MFRLLKQRLAIRRYFRFLSLELARRFGRKKHYLIEEVSTAAERGGFSMAFIAYAHAMFSRRQDFDDYYGPLNIACTYDGLRLAISRCYFRGATGFDALNILVRAMPPNQREYDSKDNAPAPD